MHSKRNGTLKQLQANRHEVLKGLMELLWTGPYTPRKDW